MPSARVALAADAMKIAIVKRLVQPMPCCLFFLAASRTVNWEVHSGVFLYVCMVSVRGVISHGMFRVFLGTVHRGSLHDSDKLNNGSPLPSVPLLLARMVRKSGTELPASAYSGA